MIVGLSDKLFSHANTASNGNLSLKPKSIQYDRTDKEQDIKIFTDQSLDEARFENSRIKIGWILESPAYFPELHKNLVSSHYLKFFNFIMTNDKSLVDKDERFVFCPTGGTWIDPSMWKIYPKNKTLSMIASSKNELKGHKLRHKIVDKFKDKIDVYGSLYKKLDDKIDGLSKYKYQIVVENCKEDYYFTEKIIDCFATGTVPIYWGCPSIYRFFDIEGIITFDTLEELEVIINELSDDDYRKRSESIKKNFDMAKKYSVIEDYIYENIIKAQYNNVSGKELIK